MMTLDLTRNEMQLEASRLETKSKDLASLKKLLQAEEDLQAKERVNLETERHLLKSAVKTENKHQLANKEFAARSEMSFREVKPPSSRPKRMQTRRKPPQRNATNGS